MLVVKGVAVVVSGVILWLDVRFTGVFEQKEMYKLPNSTCYPHQSDWRGVCVCVWTRVCVLGGLSFSWISLQSECFSTVDPAE